MTPIKYYTDSRCNTHNLNNTEVNYGYRWIYKTATNGSSDLQSSNFPYLYNSITDNSNTVGYKAQFDPGENLVLQTSMSDQAFLYAGPARGLAITNNNYTCTYDIPDYIH